MKAELWKEIEDGYFRTQNQPATHVQVNFYVQDEDYKNRFKYRCESKFNKKNTVLFIQEKDKNKIIHFERIMIIDTLKINP